MEQIEVEHLTFQYPESTKRALDDICLSFSESGFYLICGPSGCGKSTLMRQMKKNLIPYGAKEGAVLFMGQDVLEMDDRKSAEQIGFVIQNPSEGIVTDKVWHELAFGLENLGINRAEMKRRVAEMASFFGISSWFCRSVNELSGGQQQMLNLAAVMVTQPKVLLLDEPISQLDPISARDFLRMLQQINRDLGTTVLIAEHRLEELFAMADRICVLENGRAVCFDTPENTAQYYLKRAGENSQKVFSGLPAALKIACGHSRIQTAHLPLTIREGRLWMKDRIKAERQAIGGQHNNGGKACAQAALRCTDIAFSYGSENPEILQRVSVEIYAGEWFCIFGANGAGKSTLLGILCGSLVPSRGRLEVLGRRIRNSRDIPLGYGKMVLLPQNPKAMFTEITVREELEETLSHLSLDEDTKEAEVAGILKDMELDIYEKVHPYDLSGGEQQRLALAKLLLLKPSVLLLDEPTKGLDPSCKQRLGRLLRSLEERGMTIVTVTHDLDFGAEFSDRCGLLFEGEMIGVQEKHSFFRGNHFYTTAANQIARQWFPEAITCGEVLEQWQQYQIQ